MKDFLFTTDESAMNRALDIAQSGIGFVEPNPAVGSVVVSADGRWIAEGFHREFGGPHAEVVALQDAGDQARGATIYVTLEPCSHHGKTPPCADALIAAGVSRVVIATQDPAPHVAGAGIAKLRSAGIQVDIGTCQQQAEELISPFRKLFTQGFPYIHAKWAMTLDGKIASRTGSSKWISNETSRTVVHQIRGRMDAILTGIGTVIADDPMLTARPPGSRVPTRVILDSQARLRIDSKLMQSVDQAPVLIFTCEDSNAQLCDTLKSQGAEVTIIQRDPKTGMMNLLDILKELGRRQMTHVLVESGGQVLGSFFDSGHIDEVHCFIAPKMVGGRDAATPIAGVGLELMEQALSLKHHNIENLDGDFYIHGRVKTAESCLE